MCAFDGMRQYRARLAGMGIRHADKLFQVSADKWKLAIELLPEKKVKTCLQTRVEPINAHAAVLVGCLSASVL